MDPEHHHVILDNDHVRVFESWPHEPDAHPSSRRLEAYLPHTEAFLAQGESVYDSRNARAVSASASASFVRL